MTRVGSQRHRKRKKEKKYSRGSLWHRYGYSILIDLGEISCVSNCAGVWRGAGAGNALFTGGDKAPPSHLPREAARMWTNYNIGTCCNTRSYSIHCWSSGKQLVCACKLLISSLFGFLFINSLLQSLLIVSCLACENNHCEETGVLPYILESNPHPNLIRAQFFAIS